VVQSLEIADRGYVLANGRVELQGRAAELCASPEIQDAYLGA
jgi:branched-chain amino acid transport system ATP-binding protein